MIEYAISLLGFPAGILLAKIAGEEVIIGRKNLIYLHHILLIILIASLFTKNSSLIASLLFIYLLPVGSLWAKKILKKH